MKLLIADVRKEQHLADTIALLEFIMQERDQLTDLQIQLSTEIKEHTLVLPTRCIKGSDDIWDFIRKYTDTTPVAPKTQKSVPYMNNSGTGVVSPDSVADVVVSEVDSYQRSILAQGDEERDKPITAKMTDTSRQQSSRGPGPKASPLSTSTRNQPNVQAAAAPKTHNSGPSAVTHDPIADDVDIQAMMARRFALGGSD